MSIPKVMLLDSGNPYGKTVGEVLIQALCSRFPQESLIRFCLVDPMPASPYNKWLGFPLYTAKRPREWGLRRLPHWASKVGMNDVSSLLSSGSAAARQFYSRKVEVPNLVAEAVEFGKKHHVELLWVTLTGATPIYLARRIAEALNVPFVVCVWDPPELFMKYHGLDHRFGQSLLNEFGATLQAAERVVVVSTGMQQEYRQRYGVDSIVLHHAVDKSEIYPPAAQTNDTTSFTIGYAGTLYAKDEWNALLRALDSTLWYIGGRQISIRMLGASMKATTATGPMRLEFLGWHSVPETIRLLSEVDVCYLPYWFDSAYGLAVRLSFPTKLTTYLASGRPVFYHGPEDSSPADFLRRFPAGVACHSLEPDAIINGLNKLIVDANFYRMATQAGSNAINSEFDLSVLLARFAKLLGVPEDTFAL